MLFIKRRDAVYYIIVNAASVSSSYKASLVGVERLRKTSRYHLGHWIFKAISVVRRYAIDYKINSFTFVVHLRHKYRFAYRKLLCNVFQYLHFSSSTEYIGMLLWVITLILQKLVSAAKLPVLI